MSNQELINELEDKIKELKAQETKSNRAEVAHRVSRLYEGFRVFNNELLDRAYKTEYELEDIAEINWNKVYGQMLANYILSSKGLLTKFQNCEDKDQPLREKINLIIKTKDSFDKHLHKDGIRHDFILISDDDDDNEINNFTLKAITETVEFHSSRVRLDNN